MEKKKITKVVIYIILWILVALWLFFTIKEAIKQVDLIVAERVIERAKRDYAKCVVIMKDSPMNAEKAREVFEHYGVELPEELQKSVGLTEEQTATKKSIWQTTSLTGSEK